MRRQPALLILVTLAAACASGDDVTPDGAEAFVPRPLAASLAGETASLRGPQSAQYDERRDVFYITNMDGDATAKDGRAFIAVVPAETLTVMRVLVDGGTRGVTLHAPKGLAIMGDTIWVADIDAVRGFNRLTGVPVGSVDLSSHGAIYLSDVALGPNGALYVTDTGIRYGADGSVERAGPGRIFRLSNRIVFEVASGEALRSPHGIAWQDTTGTWLLAPKEGRDVLSWIEDGSAPRVLASGPGRYDGILPLRDGRVLVSSWADSTVYLMAEGVLTPLIRNVSAPGDIGYDTERGVVAVPRPRDGKVEYYQLRAVN